MLKRLLALGTAAIAALSACGDGPATVTGTWRSPATWSSLVYASNTGPLLVEVHGDPFGVGDATFRGLVAEAMDRQVHGRVVPFTAVPAEAPRPQFRVTIAFMAPPTLSTADLCAGRITTGTPGSDRITMAAAFCDGQQVLSSVSGWVDGAEGPRDKRFRQLLAQVVRALFGDPG